MFTPSTSASSLVSSCSTKSLSSFVAELASAKRIGELTNAAHAARRARSRPALPKSMSFTRAENSKDLHAFVADVLASNRLPELTNVATVARRAHPTIISASASCKALKADIACAPLLSEVQEAATAARLARSRPGPAKPVPSPSQIPSPQRAKYAYACQTVPSHSGRVEVPVLEELEVIVFPAPERRSSTLVRMETTLEDLRTNGMNAEVICRNFRRCD
ncbi:hypothetical protein AURDEDRAFT_171374 [Auricularia subglabra TFB-10046 SS5]|uniref:Uncharacterized protein n=1 Tax=Auricularia subglabra (strain TFB-10046 / SS5) TaxID=717982 RepID=J0LIW4_AURST|nr:hypothetical protein AURDEDRAFT_171374 [Auricularia subglabra TFB-10046 SS5]